MTASWKNFYDTISADGWPECPRFEDIVKLPEEIQKEILSVHLDFIFQDNLQPWTDDVSSNDLTLSLLADGADACQDLINQPTVDHFLDNRAFPLTAETLCGQIKLRYHPSMECGGRQRAPMFVEILRMIDRSRQYEHCLEWCSGPGFIGYTLLDAGICKKLDLADIWKPSLLAAATADTDHLVKTWHIRRLSDIKPQQSYDLIVANPPWFPGNLLKKDRSTTDPGLATIKQFFSDVKHYLRSDGIIVLVEGQTHTGPADFQSMIDHAGLEIFQLYDCSDNWHWFMVISHKRTIP